MAQRKNVTDIQPEHTAAAATKTATDALFTLFDNPSSQYEALATIRGLLQDCEEETAIEVTKVLAAHALPFFAAPMGDPNLQALFLHVLTLSSICGTSAAMIRDGGGIELTVAAMEAHRSNARVQEEGCWAIFRFSGGAMPWRRHQNAVTDAGGLTVAMAAMAAQMDSPDVQVAAIAAIGNLVVSHPSNQATAVESGAVVTVALAAGRHVGHEALQSYAAAFFVKITMEGLKVPKKDRLCGPILQSGGLAAVLTAMAVHPDHAGIQVHGVQLVGAMAVQGEEELSVKLIELGAAAAVLAAMRAHSGCAHLGHGRESRVISAEGIKALGALATTEGAMSLLQDEGVSFQLEVAQKIFRDDADPMVQECIQDLGARLCKAVSEGLPLLTKLPVASSPAANATVSGAELYKQYAQANKAQGRAY